MAEQKENDKYKDALFRIVFGENRENALSLYNAINNTSYTNVDDLEITMLRDSVYIGIRNDVSFLFNHDLSLYEHQSTYCPNMPLRGLGYFADLYKMHMGGDEESAIRLYDSKQVKLPTPKYYVFYNGQRKGAECIDLKLSDAYEGSGDIEIVAHMINVNKGYNTALMEHCKPMADYSEFIFRVREYVRQEPSKESAVKRAIEECIRDDILADMLRKERARVENVLIKGLTEEEKERLHEMQLSDAHKEGLQEGTFKSLDKLVSEDILDLEGACELLGVSVEDYKSYCSKKGE